MDGSQRCWGNPLIRNSFLGGREEGTDQIRNAVFEGPPSKVVINQYCTGCQWIDLVALTCYVIFN